MAPSPFNLRRDLLKGGEQGAAMIILLSFVLAILALLALAFDAGVLYRSKSSLQRATDAGALAVGEVASEISLGKEEIEYAAGKIAKLNATLMNLDMFEPEFIPNYNEDTFAINVSGSIQPSTYLAGRILGAGNLGRLSVSSEANATQLYLELVLDMSGSMGDLDSTGTPKYRRLSEATTMFLGQFRRGIDNIGIVGFAPTAWERNPISTSFPTSISISSSELQSGTNPVKGISLAMNRLLRVGTPSSRRAMVVVTDGQPTIWNGNYPLTSDPDRITGGLVDTIHTNYRSMRFYDSSTPKSSDLSYNGAMTNVDPNYYRYKRLAYMSGIQMADLARAAGIQVYTIGVGPEDTYTLQTPFGDLANETRIASPFLRRMANDPLSAPDFPYTCVKDGANTVENGCLYPDRPSPNKCLIPCVDTFTVYNSRRRDPVSPRCPTPTELASLGGGTESDFSGRFQCIAAGRSRILAQGKYALALDGSRLSEAMAEIGKNFRPRLIH